MAILETLGLIGSLGGILAGGLGSASANRKAQKQLDKQLQENENMFKKDYYQDILNRSDVQNLLSTYRKNLSDAVRAQRNSAVVTGATPEAEAAVKKSKCPSRFPIPSAISPLWDNKSRTMQRQTI